MPPPRKQDPRKSAPREQDPREPDTARGSDSSRKWGQARPYPKQWPRKRSTHAAASKTAGPPIKLRLPRLTWGRALGSIAGVLAIGIVGTILLGLWLWSTEPSYWTEHQRRLQEMGQVQRRRVAERFYKRMLSDLSSLRAMPGSPPQISAPRTRRITLPLDQVNAFLRERLPELLANQNKSMPTGVSDPLIAIDADRLVLAMRLGGDTSGGVLSLEVDPQMTADGRLRLTLVGVSSGRLPLPRSIVLDRLKQVKVPRGARDDLAMVVAVLKGGGFEPVFPIDRSRQVRILGLKLGDDAVVATIRTEPRSGYD